MRKNPYRYVALTKMEIGMLIICIKHTAETVPMEAGALGVLMDILKALNESEDASNGKD